MSMYPIDASILVNKDEARVTDQWGDMAYIDRDSRGKWRVVVDSDWGTNIPTKAVDPEEVRKVESADYETQAAAICALVTTGFLKTLYKEDEDESREQAT